MPKAVRVLLIVITTFFGLVNSLGYIINEVIEVVTRENMDGYFNAIGMIMVILSLILILTNIPSIICQIKIMRLQKANVQASGLIDQLGNQAKMPSNFLRTSNLVFAMTYCLYGLTSIFSTALYSTDSFSRNIIMVISLILLICGIILTFDGLKLKKQATTIAR